MLDELGYDQRHVDGFRLTADGNRIQFYIQAANALGSYVDIAELVSLYWQALGIDARI